MLHKYNSANSYLESLHIMKKYNKSLISCMIILVMFCGVKSDFAEHQKVCKDELISLSPCITFVTGDAKAPTPTCCTDLRKEAEKSIYCLCVLIKDRDEPDLGFKLNATLAMALLPICHVHTNATACPELLHLSPNSSEARVFEQFGYISGVSYGTSAGERVPSSSTKLCVKGLRKAVIIGLLTLVSLILDFNSAII